MLRGSIIRTRMKKSLCAFLNLYRMVRREWNPHSEDGHTVMMCWGCSRGLLYIYELFNFFFYTKPLPLTISYKQYAENKKLSMMFSSHTKKTPARTQFIFVPVSSGSGTLKVDFVGELNDKMKGFYRSKYTTSAGDIRYAAVTQFEVGSWLRHEHISISTVRVVIARRKWYEDFWNSGTDWIGGTKLTPDRTLLDVLLRRIKGQMSFVCKCWTLDRKTDEEDKARLCFCFVFSCRETWCILIR